MGNVFVRQHHADRFALLFVLVAVAGAQQSMERDAYLARIAELQQTGPEIAREQGKEALIAEYRELIDGNPGYANNIRLEAQIGLIYESDLSDTGEPPNMEAAYNQYLGTMEAYDPSHPYMKQVRTMAAKRAVELDPPAAEELYSGMIEDYPDDPTVVVSSYYELAKLAEQNGDPAAAREYYNEILNHAPQDETLSEAERLTVQQYEANAVLNLVSEAIRQAKTPEARLAALQAFIDRYPDLPYTHGVLIDDLLQSIDRMKERAEDQTDLEEAVQTLVNLLRERREEEAALSPEEQQLRREQRRQLASGGQADAEPNGRVARAGQGDTPGGGRGSMPSIPTASSELSSQTNGAQDVDARQLSGSGNTMQWLFLAIVAVIVLLLLAVVSVKLRK